MKLRMTGGLAEFEKTMVPVDERLQHWEWHTYDKALQMVSQGRQQPYTAVEFEIGIRRLSQNPRHLRTHLDQTNCYLIDEDNKRLVVAKAE
ncbi:unnamed protein product [Vitrella brassicaformis CCMP3155]|uniref:Uncharacterized protein n=1 Tax=Vitrella brassicaformis (strain CCMP3155) TaxID=1169540 RepID=A0A0G4E9H5_VITBC|nr:unnamed protein product [Vitrella brassicaformis CCMP3155]|eukprot:CEL92252.1 unnamed protein product [Vitrella brassicaformis CCMP3155]